MAEKKILIVDYDAASLEKLSKLLKSHKFHVIKASDGQPGCDKFGKEKPVDPEAFVGAIKRLLPDEDGFEEGLTDSNAVIEALSRRGRGQPSPRREEKSAHKGKRP
jgi:hypothetical protein